MVVAHVNGSNGNYGSSTKLETALMLDSNGKPYVQVNIEGKVNAKAQFGDNNVPVNLIQATGLGIVGWDGNGTSSADSNDITYIGYWQSNSDGTNVKDVPDITKTEALQVYVGDTPTAEKIVGGSINNPTKALKKEIGQDGNGVDLFSTWARAGATENESYTTWRAMQYLKGNSNNNDIILTGNLSVSLSSGLVAVLPVSGGASNDH